MDFRVYHYGVRGVFDGTRPVYGASSGLGWPMHYRYPPLFLFLFAPFALLPMGWSAAVWVVLKVVVLVLLLQSMQVLRPSPAASRFWLVPVLLAGPYIVEDFRYGNAQFFIFALTAASLLIARERPVLSAGSLALAISVKVWPLFFVPYLAARRDWKVVSYTLVFVVLLAMVPSFHFGWHGNLELLGQWFAQESQTQLGDSEIWFPNQSLRGVLMRYFTFVDYSGLPDPNYPQVHIAEMDPRTVRAVWLLLAGIAYAALLLIANWRRASDGWIEHGLAFSLVALLEPFTQKYALAVLLWPALAAGNLMKRPVSRILIYTSIVLVLIQPLAPGSTAQRFLQVLGADFAATALVAGVMVLAIL